MPWFINLLGSPTPEFRRSFGVSIAPADRIISSVNKSKLSSPDINLRPIALVPSNIISFT